MKFNFYYESEDAEKLKNEIENSYNEVKEYFDFDLDEFNVYIYKKRKDFDEQLNNKTKILYVANLNIRNKRINILHPDAFDKESDKTKEDFPLSLKHELTHLFTRKLAQEKAVPKWLNEGISEYVSGEYENRLKYNYYIEENFCKKIATSEGWNLFMEKFGAYPTSTLFVYFLVKTFSFEKIKELVASLDKNYYYPFFKEKFEDVFGNSIEETEKDFLKYSGSILKTAKI